MPNNDRLLMKPRAVQIVEHGVPSSVRHSVEYKAWVDHLKQGVNDHVKAIHITGEDGESYVSAHWEITRNGHTDMKSDAVGHYNFQTKKSDDGDGSVMDDAGQETQMSKTKSELIARVQAGIQSDQTAIAELRKMARKAGLNAPAKVTTDLEPVATAADDLAVPPLGPDRAVVEPDDADALEKFKLWLRHGAGTIDVKTDEVDGASTFFLFNKSGDYLGYYSYEAGGSYGDQPGPQNEFEALIEPKAEADLEPSSVDALIDYIESY